MGWVALEAPDAVELVLRDGAAVWGPDGPENGILYRRAPASDFMRLKGIRLSPLLRLGRPHIRGSVWMIQVLCAAIR